MSAAHGLRVVADEPRVWLNKRDAARRLGVCESTIDNWRRLRGLPSRRIGRVLRFDAAELDAWFEASSTEAQQAG